MAIRSPYWPMISSHHSGGSSAAVPMFTRAQPVARARSRLSSSRMPPDSSTSRRVCGGDLGDDLGVAAAAEGGVQIDQVDPLRAGVGPALGRGPRVPELLLGPGHALDELDGLPVRDVDGGQQHQGTHEWEPYPTHPRTTVSRERRAPGGVAETERGMSGFWRGE